MKGEINLKSSPPTTTSSSSVAARGSAAVSVAAVATIPSISVFPGASGMLAQLQRPPRTISTASYDSESDDNMQRGGPSSVATDASVSRVDSDGEKADGGDAGSNSTSK